VLTHELEHERKVALQIQVCTHVQRRREPCCVDDERLAAAGAGKGPLRASGGEHVESDVAQLGSDDVHRGAATAQRRDVHEALQRRHAATRDAANTPRAQHLQLALQRCVPQLQRRQRKRVCTHTVHPHSDTSRSCTHMTPALLRTATPAL
jgi:hypothetical protein